MLENIEVLVNNINELTVPCCVFAVLGFLCSFACLFLLLGLYDMKSKEERKKSLIQTIKEVIKNEKGGK